MREEDVELGREVGLHLHAEWPHAGAGIEDDRVTAFEPDLDTRGVAAVADGVGARGGERASAPPDACAHQSLDSSASAAQNTAITPCMSPVVANSGIGRGLEGPPRRRRRSRRPTRAPAAAGERDARGGSSRRGRLSPAGVASSSVAAKSPADISPSSAKRLAEQERGGIVVEDEHPPRVEQEGRRRERRHQVAREDQLEGLLRDLLLFRRIRQVTTDRQFAANGRVGA